MNTFQKSWVKVGGAAAIGLAILVSVPVSAVTLLSFAAGILLFAFALLEYRPRQRSWLAAAATKKEQITVAPVRQMPIVAKTVVKSTRLTPGLGVWKKHRV